MTPALRPRPRQMNRSTEAGSCRPGSSPIGHRVAGRSRDVEGIHPGPRGARRIRCAEPAPTQRAGSNRGSSTEGVGNGHGNGGFAVKKVCRGEKARRAEGGEAGVVAGRKSSAPSQRRPGTGGAEDVDRAPLLHHQPAGARRSGSETCARLPGPRKGGDGGAGALTSPSRAGERASAETVGWLHWNPGLRWWSSPMGIAGHAPAEQPVSPDKGAGEGIGSGTTDQATAGRPASLYEVAGERRGDGGNTVCRGFLGSDEQGTASVHATAPAAVPPSRAAGSTNGCEGEPEPLRAATLALLSPSNRADLQVEAAGSLLAGGGGDRYTRPPLSPIGELSFVDPPLSEMTAPGTRRLGESGEPDGDEAGAFGKPSAEIFAPPGLRHGLLLPSAEGGSARRPSPESRVAESGDAGRAGGGGVVRRPLVGPTIFGDATTHSGVCMAAPLLALSSDPFARSATADLLPVAHFESAGRNKPG